MTTLLASQLAFVKMQGAGNDFVVLDALASPLPADFDFAAAARSLCSRHFGAGSDGLLLLDHPAGPEAAIRMRMWNPDGSEDMCGNGLRCIVRLAAQRGYVSATAFGVQTLAGNRRAELLGDGRIRVAMGTPVLEPADIPVDPLRLDSSTPLDYRVPSPAGPLRCSTLSTGSTHTVIWLDDEPTEDLFQSFSPALEVDARYPERTTILWACVKSAGNVQVRIWERGVGETLACGTGACAVAVAAQLTGRCGSDVTVASKGGQLQIEWTPPGEIAMTGDAHVVYEGRT